MCTRLIHVCLCAFLRRFLAFVAVLLACCAHAVRVETTPPSLGWSMPSSCWLVWGSPASCSCPAWRAIWRRSLSSTVEFVRRRVVMGLKYLCCHYRFQAFVKEELARPSRVSKVTWTVTCWSAINRCIACALEWLCSSCFSLSSWSRLRAARTREPLCIMGVYPAVKKSYIAY